MISEAMGLLFMVIPFGCLWYALRNINEDQNPVWGNLLSTAISAILCGLMALWLAQGNIMSPVTVPNASYQIPLNLSESDLAGQISAASITSNLLSESGTGMLTRASISSSGSAITNQTLITVHTNDLVYVQFKDTGLMFFYEFLCVASIALFAWFLIDLRRSAEQEDEAEEDPNNWGGDQS